MEKQTQKDNTTANFTAVDRSSFKKRCCYASDFSRVEKKLYNIFFIEYADYYKHESGLPVVFFVFFFFFPVFYL